MKFSEKFEQTAQRLNTLSAAMLQLGAQIDRLAKERTVLANEYHAIQTQFQMEAMYAMAKAIEGGQIDVELPEHAGRDAPSA
mgnify:FL=1